MTISKASKKYDLSQLLKEQKAAIETTIDRLNYKAARYDRAMETGILSRDKEELS